MAQRRPLIGADQGPEPPTVVGSLIPTEDAHPRRRTQPGRLCCGFPSVGGSAGHVALDMTEHDATWLEAVLKAVRARRSIVASPDLDREPDPVSRTAVV
jgi:hypothetical protein